MRSAKPLLWTNVSPVTKDMVKRSSQSGVQQPDCLNDMLVIISYCQMMFAFLSRIVRAGKQLILEVTSMRGCAPITAAGQVQVWQKEHTLGMCSEGGLTHQRVKGKGHSVSSSSYTQPCWVQPQRTSITRAFRREHTSWAFCLPELMLG